MANNESSSWKEVSIEDAMEAIIDYRGKSPQKTNSGVPLVTAKIVKGGRILEHTEFIAVDDYDDWMRRGMPKPGDIVMTTEAPLGEIAQLDNRKVALAQRLITLRGRTDFLDNDFLKYMMLSRFVQHQLHARATGTTVRGIRQSELRKVKLLIPHIQEQKSIAAVLSAFDDKIELNRQMNATLEEMARALFKSWFVDFDPVRRNVAGGPAQPYDDLFPSELVVDGNGRELPMGWRVGTLNNVATIHDSIRIPLSKREREQRQGQYPYHGATSVMDYVDDFLFDGIYLLMAEDGSVIDANGSPVLQYVWGKFWVNNHAHVLSGKNTYSTEQLMLALQQVQIDPYITGAVQLKINQTNMKRIPFILAPKEVSSTFQKIIEPMYRKIRSNTDESRTLATLRDTLLPRLMSGQLRIPLNDTLLKGTYE